MSRIGPPRAEIGLAGDEAMRRLARDGPNALPDSEQRSPLRIALHAMREPMLLLLVAAGAIYLLCLPEADYITGEVIVAGGGWKL